MAGWPARTTSDGTSAEGMPIDVPVVARPWQEEVALAAGICIEARTVNLVRS
jgi:amidase